MVNKLSFLGTLKNNTGGDQTQMLADDVTKVMDEQHMLEGQYGDLIVKRGELKGISKKPELLATKKEIAVRIREAFLKLSRIIWSSINSNLVHALKSKAPNV